MQAQPGPLTTNHILAHIPPEEYEQLRPHLEPVELTSGRVLQEAGAPIEHVYFPQGSMISLISDTAAGESVEVGVIGYEGMAGLSLALGVDRSPRRALGGCKCGMNGCCAVCELRHILPRSKKLRPPTKAAPATRRGEHLAV